MDEIITLLNQASGFAKRENYPDAVARAGHALDAAKKLAETSAGDDKARAERLVAKVEREVERYQSMYDVWNAAIAAGRQAKIDGAAEEMARPLPIAPTE